MIAQNIGNARAVKNRVFTLALIAFSLTVQGCDHPYRVDGDLVSGIERGLSAVTLIDYVAVTDGTESPSCVAGKRCDVSVRVSNPRKVEFIASVVPLDPGYTDASVSCATGAASASFSFVPRSAASGKTIRFDLSLAVTGASGPTRTYRISLPCVAGAGPNDDTFSVAYDANGGSGALPPTVSDVPVGTSIVVASGGSLSKAGFVFAGWNDRADATGEEYAAGSTLVVSADVTLYARWVPLAPSYSAAYDANGGAGSVPPTASGVPGGSSIAVASGGSLTRAGFVFVGWNDRSDGSGTDYPSGSTLVVSADVTLYAQWAPSSVLSFSGNGAMGEIASVVVATGTSVILPDGAGFSYAGQTFAGWNSAADGSGAPFGIGVSVVVSADATLYAQWRNASLLACLSGIASGGSFVLEGTFSERDFADLRGAVFSSGAPVSLDMANIPNYAIPASLFSGCAQLVSVSLPDNLLYLPMDAFRNCSGLATLELNANLQGIAQYALRGCYSLTTMYIPQSVCVLEPACFYQTGLGGNSGVITFEQANAASYYEGLDYLSTCYFGDASVDIFGYGTSPANSSTFTIRVPSTAESAYEGLPLMGRYAARIVGY